MYSMLDVFWLNLDHFVHNDWIKYRAIGFDAFWWDAFNFEILHKRSWVESDGFEWGVHTCMYIYILIRTHARIHIYTNTYLHTHTHTQTNTHTHTHTQRHAHIHTHTHTRTHTHTYMDTHAQAHPNTNTYTYTHAHTHMPHYGLKEVMSNVCMNRSILRVITCTDESCHTLDE